MDGRWLAAASDESQAVLWSFPAGERLALLEGRLNKQGFFKNLLDAGSCNQVVFSPDSRYLASLDNSSRPLIWNMHDFSLHRQLEEPAADSPLHRIDFSPDSQMLAVAHLHRVALYHVETGIRIKEFRVTPRALAFHPGKKQFAVSVRDRIALFDPNVAGSQLQARKQDKINTFGEIAFSPDGRYLLAVGRSIGSRAGGDILCVWSLESGEMIDVKLDLPAVAKAGSKIHFPAGDHVALVRRDERQIELLFFHQPGSAKNVP